MSADNPQAGSELQLAGQTSDIAIYRAPEKVLAEARSAAVALQDVISKKRDPVMMNGQQYLEYEDWQTVGRFYGITAKVEKVEYVQYGSVRGFSASAVALRADGGVISQAVADCLSDEPKWSKKPKYEWQDRTDGQGRERVQVGEEDVPLFQLKSMAQTRACAKVLRNVLAWVVVLAGYRPTPAEELEREHGEGGGGGGTAKVAGSGRSEGAQQQQTTHGSGQGGGTQSAGGAGAKAGQPEGATKIRSVKVTHGKNARGDWTKYFIRFEDGRSASTFSKSDGEHAQNAEKSGAYVIPDIKKEGDFFNLSGFQPWPKKEEAKPQEHRKDEHANAEHDEPVSGPEKILLAREQNTTAGKRWAIQTNKRVVYTDQEQHFKDAVDARVEQMALTPRVEIVHGKWRLLGWVEMEEARGTTPAAGSAAPPPAAAAEAPQAEAGKEGKAPRAPRKKAGAK